MVRRRVQQLSRRAKNQSAVSRFLKDGAKYEAEIYTDNLTDQRGYNKVKISVTSADSADIAMRPSGGFAAVFREI